MAISLQSHGGPDRKTQPRARSDVRIEALLPADGDIGVDEAADFGFLLPHRLSARTPGDLGSTPGPDHCTSIRRRNIPA